MAQYDVIVNQNVATSGEQYIQRTVTGGKGRLLTFDSGNIPATLPVGTDGYVLTADSAEATGLKWAVASGGASDVFKTWTLQADSGYTWGSANVVASGDDTMDLVAGSGIAIDSDSTLKAFRIRTTGSGGLTSAYVSMTDGTTTASASGGDTFKFRSADNKLTVAVTDNDATHGDNLLITVNEANINHDNLAGFDANEHFLQSAISITASQVSDFDTEVANNSAVVANTAKVTMTYPGAGIALSTGSAWDTSITNNSANWNTAFSWGDHDGLYDTVGSASSAVSTHESTFNHANYNTAYSHSQIITGNPHDISWSDLSGIQPAPANHDLLGSSHDAVAADPLRGALIVGNENPLWTRLSLGTDGTVLRSDGTDAYWGTLSYSDITGTPPGGDVSWGTATNEYIVVGSASNDIQSFPTLSYDSSTYEITINPATTVGGKIDLQYNSVSTLQLQALNSESGTITSPNVLQLYTTNLTGGRMALGNGNQVGYWLTISDPNTTANSALVQMINSAVNQIAVFNNDGTILFPELGSDDTEDHVVAIDDSTGLLTKRSVASILSGGGFGDVSWGTATSKYIVFGSDPGAVESDNQFYFDSSNRKIVIENGTQDSNFGINRTYLQPGGGTRTDLYPTVADGASALAYLFDTVNNLSTIGAEIAAFRNQGTDVLTIDKDGNVNIPTGAEYRINGVAIGSGDPSPLTTKGDIYTYSTADARLPVGTNGYVLSANSLTTTGLEWVSPSTFDIYVFQNGIAEAGNNVQLNFGNLTNETVLADDDEFAYRDDSVSQHRALTYSALKTALNSDLSFGSGSSGSQYYINYSDGSGGWTASKFYITDNTIYIDNGEEFRLNAPNGMYLIAQGGSLVISPSVHRIDFGNSTDDGLNREIRVAGSGTNINLLLTPKGTGTVTTSSAHTANITADDDVITKGYADANYGGSGVSFGTAVSQIPFTNSGLDDFNYDSDFYYNSVDLYVPSLRCAGSLYMLQDELLYFGTAVTLSAGVPGTDIEFKNTSATLSFLFETAAYVDSGDLDSFRFNTTGTVLSGSNLFVVQNAGVDQFTIDKDGNVNIPTGAEYRVNGVAVVDTNYWTDASGYLIPNDSGDSVRLDGTTGAGFYVTTAYTTGMSAAGTTGSELRLHANNVNVAQIFSGFAQWNVPLRINNGSGSIEFTSGAEIRTSDNASSPTQDLTIRTGDATDAGGDDSGDIFIYPGDSTAGTRGDVYLGDGTAGGLKAKVSETNVVYYDTATGKLSYGTAGGGSLWTEDTNGITYTAGNVGIGVASNATYDLRVAGTVYFDSKLLVSGGGDNFQLYAGSTADHVYMEFFADSAAQTTRSAYIGFASAGTTDLNIYNEFTNANTMIRGGSGTGSVRLYSGSTLMQYSLQAAHYWYIAGTAELALDSNTLYPNTDNGLSLGTSDKYWNNLYATATYTDSLTFGITATIKPVDLGGSGHDLTIIAGLSTTAPGGDLFLKGGTSGGATLGGAVEIEGGNGYDGGDVFIRGFPGNATGQVFIGRDKDGNVNGSSSATPTLIVVGSAAAYMAVRASSSSYDAFVAFQQSTTTVGLIGWDDSVGGIKITASSSLSSSEGIFIGDTYRHVAICSTSDNVTYELYVAGDIYATGNIVAYSDIRYKNVHGYLNHVLDDYVQLNPFVFEFIDGEKGLMYGLSAQELGSLFPYAVTYDETEDKYGIRYNSFAAITAAAVIQVKTEVDALKERVVELEKEIELLKK
jgi:hypothetical protein